MIRNLLSQNTEVYVFNGDPPLLAALGPEGHVPVPCEVEFLECPGVLLFFPFGRLLVGRDHHLLTPKGSVPAWKASPGMPVIMFLPDAPGLTEAEGLWRILFRQPGFTCVSLVDVQEGPTSVFIHFRPQESGLFRTKDGLVFRAP